MRCESFSQSHDRQPCDGDHDWHSTIETKVGDNDSLSLGMPTAVERN